MEPPQNPGGITRGPKAARQRRLQAARLFQQGHSQAEVARRLGVARQTASRWHARWLAGGRAGLAGPGRWGRPSRLTDRDWRRVERALLRGAQAHGFDTDLWTLARGGVAPDQKGALKQGAWICFADESGAALTPPVRRTWAPRGHTPILRHRMRGRKRVSLAGVCCYRPDGSDARLAFHLREGAYDTDQLLGVVGGLQRLLAGDRGLGQPARPHQYRDARLGGRPARVAPDRIPARLRPRPEPGGGPVGQPERGGAGQPCLRIVGGVGRGGRAGCVAGTGRTRSAVLVPASGGAFPMSVTSFYETL